MGAERPSSDWEARVAKAKLDGGWYGPDEEPSPYPPRIRRRRFLMSFALTSVVGVVVHALLHLVARRPGSVISGDVLLDGLFQGLLPAFIVGWGSTRPPRKKSPEPKAGADEDRAGSRSVVHPDPRASSTSSSPRTHGVEG